LHCFRRCKNQSPAAPLEVGAASSCFVSSA
jgi:hypothetical protein